MLADSVLCVVNDRAVRKDDSGEGGQNRDLIERNMP